MHKKTLIGPALLAALILAGCGGNGGGSRIGSSNLNMTRTLVGFVYVKSASNTSTSQPQVVVSPAATPPFGYDIPISGYLSLIVQSGQFLANQSGTNNQQIFTKDLSTGNDLLITVATVGTAQITVAGDQIMSNNGQMTLVQYNENLSDGFAVGTTHNLNSPTNPDLRKPNKATIQTVRFTLDGVDPASPGPNSIIAGQQHILAIAYLDAQGISVPGIPAYGGGLNLTSDSPRVIVNSATNTVTAAPQGQYPGIANVTAAITTPSSVSGVIPFNFGYGPAANITLSMKTTSGTQRIDLPSSNTTITLRWDVISNPRSTTLPSNEILLAQVTNRYGAPIPGIQVDWTDPKVDNTNTWKTSAGGNAFVDPTSGASTPNSTTDLTGTATAEFQVPNPIDGPLAGLPADLNDQNGYGDQAVKGPQRVVGTVDGTTTSTSSTVFYITRQILSLQIAEQIVSKYLDVNAYSSVPYTAYAIDVDNWQSLDTFAANWRVTPVLGGVKLGDVGERDMASHISLTPTPTMSGNNLQTGPIAGGATIQAYTSKADGTDDVVSAPYTVNIWGPPQQIVMLYGPVPGSTNEWETAEFPTAIYTNSGVFTEPATQVRGNQFLPNPNPPAVPTEYDCTLYLGWIDGSGIVDYSPYGDVAHGPLYGNVAPILGTKNLTFNYQSPAPPGATTSGGAKAPSSPTGNFGSQCVVIIWGPLLDTNGSLTLEYKGTWGGSIQTSPAPSASVPYDVVRIIRILGPTSH